MTKVKDLRAVIEAASAMHSRVGSHDVAQMLMELSDALRCWDAKTIKVLVTQLNSQPADRH